MPRPRWGQVRSLTTIYIATGDALAVLRRSDGRWRADLRLTGRDTYCVAVDPLAPHRVYCGTFGQGLWRSVDADASWAPAGEGIPHGEVTAVAVSPRERTDGGGVVWAGTEPSALFRSEDGGDTWRECPALRALPSAPTWSFPPRPWTSHVRAIAPDPAAPERLLVGIELGGVMRSLDAGLTWEDHNPGAQPDAHALATHPLAPGYVYEAAGGGYAASRDGGATWQRDDRGLAHHYLWGLAVDPADPETVVVSASPGPRQAHTPSAAESTVYRRTAGDGDGDGDGWREARDGLPGPRGVRAYVLASNGSEPGVFYAATAGDNVYRSPDAGLSWEKLDTAWPEGYAPPSVNALVVVEDA